MPFGSTNQYSEGDTRRMVRMRRRMSTWVPIIGERTREDLFPASTYRRTARKKKEKTWISLPPIIFVQQVRSDQRPGVSFLLHLVSCHSIAHTAASWKLWLPLGCKLRPLPSLHREMEEEGESTASEICTEIRCSQSQPPPCF